jgi:hypothetical protein
MPPWLTESLGKNEDIHLATLITRLVLAFALGGGVAFLYWITHRRDETLSRSFPATLVLLSILIAMVTQVIGDSVARAFSLVGALSIVRFRTVVEDTRDTAFVIFAVIVGMAMGAGHPEVALVGLVVVGVAAAVMRVRPVKTNGVTSYWSLTLRVGLSQTPDTLFGPIFRQRFSETRLLSANTGRQGAVIDLTYKVRLLPDNSPTVIVAELNTLEGVQNVELRAL